MATSTNAWLEIGHKTFTSWSAVECLDVQQNCLAGVEMQQARFSLEYDDRVKKSNLFKIRYPPKCHGKPGLCSDFPDTVAVISQPCSRWRFIRPLGILFMTQFPQVKCEHYFGYLMTVVYSNRRPECHCLPIHHRFIVISLSNYNTADHISKIYALYKYVCMCINTYTRFSIFCFCLCWFNSDLVTQLS